MARSTINLDKLPKLQRWAGKQTGEKMSIGQVLEWLETDAAGDLKTQLHPMIVRDTVRLGSVDNLLQIQALGYDLTKTCSYQVDGNALHVAAQYNRQAQAMALVKMGLSPTQRIHKGGPSALDEALINGYLPLFEKLMEAVAHVDDTMKHGFLAAARSGKVHAPGNNHDAMKKKVFEYVLDRFGPYPQPMLDEAMHTAARESWLLTFQLLLEKGADPTKEVPFIRSWGHGNTTLLGTLFAHAHPKRWPDLIDWHGHLTQALFPDQSATDTNLWNIQRIAKVASAYAPGYESYNLEGAISRAVAIQEQQLMDQRLPAPSPPTRSRGRRL